MDKVPIDLDSLEIDNSDDEPSNSDQNQQSIDYSLPRLKNPPKKSTMKHYSSDMNIPDQDIDSLI